MKLQEQEIVKILSSKGLICENLNEYKNLDTILKLKCKKNHCIEASIKTIRNALFKCPFCVGEESVNINNNADVVPEKNGFRIIAIDNATENVGVSIYDNKKLTYYHLYHIEGDTISRISKNRKMILQFITEWKPDFVVLEDIQYQNNIQTYKVLAMLLGNALVLLKDNNIKYETVYSKVWRSHFLITGKTRIEQKKQAIKQVKDMYNIDVNDDIAEAVLLGKYAADCLNKEPLKILF